jgi:hypothetical protein
MIAVDEITNLLPKGYIIMAVLKLKKHDERKEIDFELDYLLSLTNRQRFEMMFEKSRQAARVLKRNGRRKTTKVIKRK